MPEQPETTTAPVDTADATVGAPARRRPRRPVVLAVGLVFLFTPAVAYLSGVRATEIENRPLADFPSLSSGWSFFPEATTWATDHLPLRGFAVSANARVSRDLFGEAPRLTTSGTGPGTGPVGPVAPVPGGRPAGERSYPVVLEGAGRLAVPRRGPVRGVRTRGAAGADAGRVRPARRAADPGGQGARPRLRPRQDDAQPGPAARRVRRR